MIKVHLNLFAYIYDWMEYLSVSICLVCVPQEFWLPKATVTFQPYMLSIFYLLSHYFKSKYGERVYFLSNSSIKPEKKAWVLNSKISHVIRLDVWDHGWPSLSSDTKCRSFFCSKTRKCVISFPLVFGWIDLRREEDQRSTIKYLKFVRLFVLSLYLPTGLNNLFRLMPNGFICRKRTPVGLMKWKCV